jgi:hypothetical protein
MRSFLKSQSLSLNLNHFSGHEAVERRKHKSDMYSFETTSFVESFQRF